MKAVIYTRVSDKSQIDGYSLEDQERACFAYAETRGWTVTKTYSDEGRSAYSGATRPQFEAMLLAARLKQFDQVLIYKFDRLSRNTAQQFQITADLELLGITICSVTEPLDRRTAMGKMSFGIEERP